MERPNPALPFGRGSSLVAVLLAYCAVLPSASPAQVTGTDPAPARLLPPALRLAPVRNETTFFGEIEQLKSRLDRDRTDVQADDPLP